jgi:hypothetical protein
MKSSLDALESVPVDFFEQAIVDKKRYYRIDNKDF